jgi:hypothetical protein
MAVTLRVQKSAAHGARNATLIVDFEVLFSRSDALRKRKPPVICRQETQPRVRAG